VSTIVCHTAQGATNYRDLGAWFANPSAQVSSHVGIDDSPGVIGEYVQRGSKAWTAGNANPWSIQAELCAFAEWSSAEWANHQTMLDNTAAWIAEEAAFFGIPLVALSPADAQNPNVRGVCQHVDLGSMGGGHWDCGPNFPLDDVLARAAGTTTPTQQSAPASSEDSTVCIVTAPGRVDLFVVGTDHGVYQAQGTDQHSLARSGWLRIGDEHTYAKAVSAAWTPDYKTLYVTVHGSDDHPYVCHWDGAAWSAFDGNNNGTMTPDPYDTEART
jgi:hypothetical protein